jgi:hypothetical protein
MEDRRERMENRRWRGALVFSGEEQPSIVSRDSGRDGVEEQFAFD